MITGPGGGACRQRSKIETHDLLPLQPSNPIFTKINASVWMWDGQEGEMWCDGHDPATNSKYAKHGTCCCCCGGTTKLPTTGDCSVGRVGEGAGQTGCEEYGVRPLDPRRELAWRRTNVTCALTKASTSDRIERKQPSHLWVGSVGGALPRWLFLLLLL